jgi:HAD superfamily hydrolase (TIGR01549 family)
MIKNIIFDFDGVILDSMAIREFGFREILKQYLDKNVSELIRFHNDNGGLSRFVKLRYFFEEILEKTISEEELNNYAEKYSTIMRKELVKESYQIRETMDFIKNNSNRYRFFIVSGSEQNELRYLCKMQGIDHYFQSVLGSPADKKELVMRLLQDECCDKDETILIGDSINDFEAATKNGIRFYGYNAPRLKNMSDHYLSNYNSLSY